MRTLWKGSLNFGLIAIPVGLAATHTHGGVTFRTLHAECGTPIKQKRFCPFHERDVADEELAKGWEVAPGQFVVVDEAELEAIAPDGGSRAIDIIAFVRADEVPALWPNKTYYLAPAEEQLGRRSYALVGQALRETQTVALGRFVAFGAEHLCVVYPLAETGRALVLSTIHFPEDEVPADPIEKALASCELAVEETDLARELIETRLRRIARLDLTSVQRPRVRALLEDKLAGREIVRPEPAPAQAALPTVDLADALRRSIRESRPRRKQSRARRRPAARR